MKKPHEILYAVASGPERRRALLTPVGLLIITVLMFLVVVGSLFTDRMLALPKLLPGTSGSLIGLLLLAAGLGFLFESVSMVFVWTPMTFGLHALALKRVEEPEGQLRIELRGNLAAMLTAAQQTKRSPETGDLLVPVQLVAGGRNQRYLQLWIGAA